MPPKSVKQAKFMRAVASGSVKAPGLSRAQAREYVEGHPTKQLPEKARAKKGR